MANFLCHNFGPLPLSWPSVDTENRHIPYAVTLQKQLQGTIIHLDFQHLFSTKISKPHSFTLPLFSTMSAILADSLHLCRRSPEEMGPKTRQPEAHSTRVDGLRRSEYPVSAKQLSELPLGILAAFKDTPEDPPQPAEGKRSTAWKRWERVRSFRHQCEEWWGSDVFASSCRVQGTPHTHSHVLEKSQWFMAVAVLSGWAPASCCQFQQNTYQVGHNDGVDDDRAGWSPQCELESPRWLPSCNVIAVSFQQQVLQLVLCSYNTVHL